jgi:NAD(P)-dependent dehydrogenase (short-subunit alcohol dehydrogenase family)
MNSAESRNFSGQHALVTGGGTGIGAAVATLLARNGARLTLLGRNREALEAHASTMGASVQVADVTSKEAVDGAFARAKAEQGPISILINNAGAGQSDPFPRTSVELWSHMLAVNLTSVFHCTQAVIGDMKEARYGRIINVASMAGLKGYRYIAAYCAAKHGVVGLTRALAQEFADKGITVNAVCPGYVETDLVTRSVDNITRLTGRSRDEALAELLAVNPQKRLIRPEEVAATIVWLCSSEAASVNGAAIPISGGEAA